MAVPALGIPPSPLSGGVAGFLLPAAAFFALPLFFPLAAVDAAVFFFFLWLAFVAGLVCEPSSAVATHGNQAASTRQQVMRMNSLRISSSFSVRRAHSALPGGSSSPHPVSSGASAGDR